MLIAYTLPSTSHIVRHMHKIFRKKYNSTYDKIVNRYFIDSLKKKPILKPMVRQEVQIHFLYLVYNENYNYEKYEENRGRGE